MQDIREKVIAIVLPLAAAQPAAVTDATRIIDDLDVSSADLIEIVLELEDAFGIEIADEESSTLETVGDVCGLVAGKLAGTEATPP